MYFICFALIVSLYTCEGTYRNYALLHGMPRNKNELKYFNNMEKLYNVTFWRRPGKVNDPVEFTISPLSYVDLMMDTEKKNIRFKTLMEDVQVAFDQQVVKRYFRREMNSFNWNQFYGLDDIYNWLKDLATAYPKEVQLLNIGKSVESRDIFGVKLKINKINSGTRLKVIVEGGCHGSEWISPAFVTYMIHALLNANSSNSAQLKLVAPMYDWMFVPIMNPDGYVYSQTHDRLWRKNRVGGYGVDLNRNFGILFGKVDAKTDKNADTYCGKEAFSEPESTAMASFVRDNSLNLEYYLSFHSYGQYIIIPYSFTKQHEDNYDVTKIMADNLARKLFRKYNVIYKVGNSFETVGYLASGNSNDWVKRAANVTYVASFVLPDTGLFGLALPPDLILPICERTMDGLLSFLDPPNNLNAIHELRERTNSGVTLKDQISAGVIFFVAFFCILNDKFN